MKTLSLFTLSVILSLDLSARENPFEATNAYEEEAARIIEQYETEEEAALAAQEAQYIQQMQKKMSETTSMQKEENKVEDAVKKLVPAMQVKKTQEKTYSTNEVKKLIKKAQVQTEVRTKKLIKKELEKTKMVEPQQVVFVKPRTDIIDEDPLKTKKILPFIDVEYNNKKFTIYTDFKVSKKFTLEKEKKIIIDYKAKTNFYTKRDMLESKEFLKIAVGNHKKEKFFRVVLEVSNKPSLYKVNYKNDLITITRLDEM